jgi:hypothetical protein
MKLRPIIDKQKDIHDRNKLIALILGVIGFIIGIILWGLYLTKILWK